VPLPASLWIVAARALVDLGLLFPDHREMDDGLHGLFHILPAYPFQTRMKGVLASENVGGRAAP